MSSLLIFETDDLGKDYQNLLEGVMASGDSVSPRGMEVREVRPLFLALSQPERCFTKRPGINRALAYMEICQILAGDFQKPLFDAISPLASKLLTAGGAYGPRTAEQLTSVIHELTLDSDSRRGVAYVGRDSDLARIHESSTTDQPCTLSWQFFNRYGQLEMIVNMRSWDLVWGLANDVPCFVAVQQAIAWAMDLKVGGYSHLAGSAHIYERHYEMASLVEPSSDILTPLVPLDSRGAGLSPIDKWNLIVADAAEALRSFNHFMDTGLVEQVPSQWKVPFELWKRRVMVGHAG